MIDHVVGNPYPDGGVVSRAAFAPACDYVTKRRARRVAVSQYDGKDALGKL